MIIPVRFQHLLDLWLMLVIIGGLGFYTNDDISHTNMALNMALTQGKL